MKRQRSTTLTIRAGILGLALALAGCTTYRDEFTPPASESGRMCAANCTTARQSCQLLQQSVAQSFALQCERDHRREMDAYQQCKSAASSGRCNMWGYVTKQINGQTVNERQCLSKSYSGSHCVEPKRCRTGTGADTCQPNYKACFVACGGRIDRVEN